MLDLMASKTLARSGSSVKVPKLWAWRRSSTSSERLPKRKMLESPISRVISIYFWEGKSFHYVLQGGTYYGEGVKEV